MRRGCELGVSCTGARSPPTGVSRARTADERLTIGMEFDCEPSVCLLDAVTSGRHVRDERKVSSDGRSAASRPSSLAHVYSLVGGRVDGHSEYVVVPCVYWLLLGANLASSSAHPAGRLLALAPCR